MTLCTGGPCKNPSFVLKGISDVVFEDRPVPDATRLDAHDVLVAPKATGICGSDVHYYRHGGIGDFILRGPMVLGHESSGVVVAVGSKVRDLSVGDRVALEPGRMCRRCQQCKEGVYELCPDMAFAATPPYDGTLAGYYKLPSDLCYKLPDSLSMEEGCMMEPLAVAVHALAKLAQLKTNQNVVIFGPGLIGLLCMAVAKALGAKRIIAVGRNEARLRMAANYAATDIWQSSPRRDGETSMEYSRREAARMSETLSLGSPADESAIDVAVDCTGAEACIAQAIMLLKPAGVHVQVGCGSDNVAVPMNLILNKEIKMIGSFRYGPGVYKLAIDLVAQGKIQLKPLITHQYKFDQAKDAFKCMVDGTGYDGKVPIKCIITGPDA